MEKFEVSRQLTAYLTAVALGMAAAAVYDLLRLVRLRRRRNRRLTHALDGLFLLLLVPAALWYTVQVGGGELRLIMLSAMGLGAVVYGLALSPLFLPVWDCWLTAAVTVCRWLWLPLGFFARLAKKSFSFLSKCGMIGARRGKGARSHGTGEEEGAAHQSGAAGTAAGAGGGAGGGAGAFEQSADGGAGGGIVPDPTAPTAAAGERCAGK